MTSLHQAFRSKHVGNVDTIKLPHSESVLVLEVSTECLNRLILASYSDIRRIIYLVLTSGIGNLL